MKKGPVPDRFRFLAELGSSFGLRDGDSLTRFPALALELQYSSDHATTIEFASDVAIVRLDVRFVEAVLDFLSCLRLPEPRAAAARAFLVVYKMVLDLSLARGDDAFVIGLAHDYIVSRVTAECEIADVTSDEADFTGSDLQDLAEKVALYICGHEIVHWRLAHDPEYRLGALDEVKLFLANALAHSGNTMSSFQEQLRDMSAQADACGPDDILPLALEEWVCDYLAAKSIGKAVAGLASRSSAEAALYATNIMLWARSRFRLMLAGATFEDAERIDRAIGLERATMLMFSLFSAQQLDEQLPIPDRPAGDFLDQLASLAEQAVAGFLDGQNVVRLIGIGTVAREFGLSDTAAARDAIARITEW